MATVPTTRSGSLNIVPIDRTGTLNNVPMARLGGLFIVSISRGGGSTPSTGSGYWLWPSGDRIAFQSDSKMKLQSGDEVETAEGMLDLTFILDQSVLA